MIWKVLSEKAIVNTPWLKVFAQKCQSPSGTIIDPFYTIENPDWVMILASDTDSKMIMVRQYRHGSKKVLDEFPAGIKDSGESVIECAQRELSEETGYSGGQWIFLRDFSVNPDRQTTRFSVVLAQNLSKKSHISLDVTEELEVYLRSIDEVDRLFDESDEVHPLHLLAWKMWRDKFIKS